MRFGEHCIPICSDKQQQNDLDCIFHTEMQTSLKLSIGWSNGLHWKTIEIEPLLLNQGIQTSCNKEKEPRFQVTYEAQKRFNPVFRGIMIMGRVTSLHFLGKLEEAWQSFVQSHGHRLVCKIRLGVGTRSCQTYLGRAQKIETNDGGERTYAWEAREGVTQEDGHGFPSPRTQDDWEIHVREARELALLKPNSPRTEPVSGVEVDHDGFENVHRVLPIALRLPLDKEVQLQFFNLLNGKFVESSHVAWTLKPQRRSLRSASDSLGAGQLVLKVTPQFTATVHFQQESVTRVTLVVQDYATSLVKMGDGLPPNTI